MTNTKIDAYVQQILKCIDKQDVENILKSKNNKYEKINAKIGEIGVNVRTLLTETLSLKDTDCSKIIRDTRDKPVALGGWGSPGGLAKKVLEKLFGDDFVMKKEDETSGNNSSLNQILYGPPGTGKTYNTINKAIEIIENRIVSDDEDRKDLKEKFEAYKENGQIEFITFHQSYAYEEFIEGIKPKAKKCDEEEDDNKKDISYCIKDGVFKRLCSVASKEGNEDKKYILIIDEINRGNISKIFGELITLIEESKRVGSGKEDTTVSLPYSEDDFGVPNNLYIIGTMNTADRSIAHIDTALRRRFEFVEMMPKTGDEDEELNFSVESINIKSLLKIMNERIEVLYDREHTIGHAYFMDLDNNSTIGDLAHIFKNKIIPLLAEYFYSDWSKINLVLNDNNFISEEERKVGNISKKMYSINEEQLQVLQEYKDIVKKDNGDDGE